MQMDTRIPLAGMQPDFVGAMRQGNALAGEANMLRQQNALANLFQRQGPQIAAGDQNALNALARFDPNAALGVQQTRQGMQINTEQLNLARQNAQRATAEFAARMDQAQRERAAQQYERGIAMLTQAETPEQFAQVMQTPGFMEAAEAIVGPGMATFENRNLLIAGGVGVTEALKMGQSTVEWRAATPEEATAYGASAGQINERTGEFKRTPPSNNETIEALPGGGFRIVRGDATGGQSVGLEPSSPEAMLSSIDGILSDPALDTSTGIFSPLQAIPGTPQRRFGARANQLEGQAFLQAFESLKGGGAITEIEGQKATQAIGRLDTAQSPADYRAALTELREILATGIARQNGTTAPGETTPAPSVNVGDAPAGLSPAAQEALRLYGAGE